MAATFIAEAYTPAATAVGELELRARLAAEELSREGTPIRYLHSLFVPADETCFHLFEARSAAAVAEASTRAALEAHRIVRATAAPFAPIREEEAR